MYKNGRIGDRVISISSPHVIDGCPGVVTDFRFNGGLWSYFVKFNSLDKEYYMYDDELLKVEDPNDLLKEIL